MHNKIKIETLLLGPLETNCYVVWTESSKNGVVIDPADDGSGIWKSLAFWNVELKAILLTHGHFDHMGGLKALWNSSRVPVYIHDADLDMLRDAGKNFSAFMSPVEFHEEVHGFQDSQDIQAGDLHLTALYTPGHSPGSAVFVTGQHAFVGDTLFYDGVGRTDLPGGSEQALFESIRMKILTLPDDTCVYPGHGDSTTIGRERRENPFLAGSHF